jgi:Uri superfamily endonuclease
MDKGVYCLVLENPGCTVRIGALGEMAFSAGWHIYVGSALGSGGLKRLDRHISLAREQNKRPKWHVDYLLTDPHFSLKYVVSSPTTDPLECSLARNLGEPGVTGFGCSDCTCPTHLFFRIRDPRKEILAAFRDLNLVPAVKSIISREGE